MHPSSRKIILSLFTYLVVCGGITSGWSQSIPLSAQKLEPEWGHDPSRITVDELVGVWVAMLGVPVNWLNLLLAFGLFRLFDIWKPLGIRKLEKLPGGWGVMVDDVAAGVAAGVCLHVWLMVST